MYHNKMACLFILALALAGCSHPAIAERKPTSLEYPGLNPKRVAEIEAMLPEKPAGLGPTIVNRAAWESGALRNELEVTSITASAEKRHGKKMPAWEDDAYMEYWRSGDRERGQKILGPRTYWLYPLVLAECLENRGRFLPDIETAIPDLLSDKSWVLPAHDFDHRNFDGKLISIDLHAASRAQNLAQMLHLLGNKLQPETRKAVEIALRNRIFDPYLRILKTEGKGEGSAFWWLTCTNNWNAVCLSGVTGAALSILPDRRERAIFAAAAEHYSKFFLSGIPSDGFCSEGVGYWNYGFGHYIRLRQILYSATAGKVDLMNDPKVRAISMYGFRIQMAPGLTPGYSDGGVNPVPQSSLLQYCDRVLGLRALTSEAQMKKLPMGVDCDLYWPFVYQMAAASPLASGMPRPEAVGVRSFFDQAMALVARPNPSSPGGLSFFIKAGGNDSHSHNDIGSYVIGLGDKPILGDPGGVKAYRAETFSGSRYDSKVLNSYGHPVPVVAGRLQVEATKVHARVLSRDFKPEKDQIEFDIAPAYQVETLRSLHRRATYSRKGLGSVTIEDEFSFTSPQTFESVLITRGQWRKSGENDLVFYCAGKTLTATILAPGQYEVVGETIKENCEPFQRLSIRLKAPLTSGAVRITFVPSVD